MGEHVLPMTIIHLSTSQVGQLNSHLMWRLLRAGDNLGHRRDIKTTLF